MSTQRRRRGPRGDIGTEDFLDAADRILDRDGLAGLTLRALARQAGVTPTVLYTYFEDMAGLRNRIGDDFLGRLDLTLLHADQPREGLRRFLVHAFEVFDQAPGHVELLASQRIAGMYSLALSEALLGFFVEAAGHSPEQAAGTSRLVTEWVHGRMLLAPSNPVSAGFAAALNRLDLSAYPRTAQALDAAEDDSALDLLVGALTPEPI